MEGGGGTLVTRLRRVAAVLLSIVCIGPWAMAASTTEPPMTVKVASRGGTGGKALVYLEGRIDVGAPDRLASALAGVQGQITIWLESPEGNLFAGMQLGRVIREH